MKRMTLFLCTLFAAGCSSPPAREPVPDTTVVANEERQHTITQTGKASFYADKYQGGRTASGDLFDHADLTAAHASLPFGTEVKVTNISNGKSVLVTVTDRGPFVAGRIIDLTKSAFDQIGDRSAGVISVRIEVME